MTPASMNVSNTGARLAHASLLTPVAVLTGFLGSGKTTLLQHVMQSPAMKRAALIINEFGEVSIDHLLVAKATDNIIELRNGCLCCTIRGDLALTLRDLYRKRLLGEIPSFDYVVIETTGLADPVPILHTLITNEPLRKAFYPDAVITCIEAVAGSRTLDEHECALAQCAIADVILVTKTDLADSQQLSEVLARIRMLNGKAEAHQIRHGVFDHEMLFGRSLFEANPGQADLGRWLGLDKSNHHDHLKRYVSHVLSTPGNISMAGMAIFMNRLVNQWKDEVLRVKGIFGARERDGKPAVVHGVGDKFYPVQWLAEWPDADHSSRFVIIGARLDTATIDAMFADLCIT